MNKTALITGASKRIGKALTEHLAEKGWNVIVHYNTSGEAAERLVSSLSQNYKSQRFFKVQANLSNTNEVVGLIPKVVSKIGEFDLLINNASVFDKSYVQETSTELYDAQFNINLKAPFFLIRDFANYCKNGNVVNFVDTRITSNKSDFGAYSLSKKGLWELTKMAALELSPEIRVNAIAPGVTLSPEDKDESYLENMSKNIPMKRPGGINPVLKSLDYILENDYLTGQILFADGGENLGINM